MYMLACGFAQYNLGTSKVLANPNESERKLHLSLTEDLANMGTISNLTTWLLTSQGPAGNWDV